MTENYNLFLDDTRQPENVYWVKLPNVQWTITKSYDEFIATIKHRGIPQIASFDHDLHESHYEALRDQPDLHVVNYNNFDIKTGYHCVKWMVKHCAKHNLQLPKQMFIHTMNPIGRDKMIAIINQSQKFLGM